MANKGAPEDELANEREELLAAYDAISTPAALYEFQLQLAATIKEREPGAFVEKRQDSKDHLRLLRLLGDGLAWRFLHPYAIRQLAKNPGPPPALGSQAEGFDATLRAAEEITRAGGLVLISDLTHLLRIGDLVICNDPENPMLVECGGHPAYRHKGRKGRQFERANAAAQLLRTGNATFPGDRFATTTLAVSVTSAHSWPVVDRVVRTAKREGWAAELADPSDLVFAIGSDHEAESPEALRGLTQHMERPTVDTYTRLLDRPGYRTPPCTAWDISAESRRWVFQGEVFVGHVVDLAAFIGRRQADAEIVRVLGTDKQITGFGITVGDDDQVTMTSEFLGDVLLGFSTIESTANAMLAGALGAVGMADANSAGVSATEADLQVLDGIGDPDGFLRSEVWRGIGRQK